MRSSLTEQGIIFYHLSPPDRSCYPTFMESLQAVGDLKTEGPNFAVATLVIPLLEFEIEEAIYVGGEGEVRQVFAFPAAHFL